MEADRPDRRLAGKSHRAAEQVEVAKHLLRDLGGDAQVVRGDREIAVIVEVTHDRERRGPGIDHDDGVVGDERCRERADPVLRIRVDLQTHIQLLLGGGDGCDADRPAVGAHHESLVVQLLQIAAHGVGGDIEVFGQLGDSHLFGLGDVRHDLRFSSGGQPHLGWTVVICHALFISDQCGFAQHIHAQNSKYARMEDLWRPGQRMAVSAVFRQFPGIRARRTSIVCPGSANQRLRETIYHA